MTQQDLDTGSLGWCCYFPDLDEMVRLEQEENGPWTDRADVPLAEAVEGMRAAVRLPGTFGRSTTVQYLGLWVRWQLSRIDEPVLTNVPMVEYQG